MASSALWWLFFNLLSIIFLAFYSMIEMACVSFNKVRLHYYVHKGNRRAKWLNFLLHHPFRLFGTTLIGVNVAMVAGSECAREFHSAIGVNPDLAPLSQVIIVVILGELAPMFAARHYAENVAMAGAPLLYGSARLLTPAIWVIGWISKAANYFLKGKTTHSEYFLSQEELQKILEEREPYPVGEEQEFNVITRNIFKLRHKTASDILIPLEQVPKLPSNATVTQMKNLIKRTDANFIIIYYKNFTNVVGIAFPRDLIRAANTKRVRDFARSPWFVTEKTHLPQILKQFKRNKESVSVILNKKGIAKGIITLDNLLSEIFGESEYKPPKEKTQFFMERTFPGEMTVKEFNDQFSITMDMDEDLTLSELMTKVLKRHPEMGDTIYIEPLELTAKETTLLEVKSVTIKSRL